MVVQARDAILRTLTLSPRLALRCTDSRANCMRVASLVLDPPKACRPRSSTSFALSSTVHPSPSSQILQEGLHDPFAPTPPVLPRRKAPGSPGRVGVFGVRRAHLSWFGRIPHRRRFELHLEGSRKWNHLQTVNLMNPPHDTASATPPSTSAGSAASRTWSARCPRRSPPPAADSGGEGRVEWEDSLRADRLKGSHIHNQIARVNIGCDAVHVLFISLYILFLLSF